MSWLEFLQRLGLHEGVAVVKGHLHLTTLKLWPPCGDHNSGTHAVLMRKIHTNVEWDKTMGWHFILRDQRSPSLHRLNSRQKPISGHKSARMKGKRKWVCFTGDWKLSWCHFGVKIYILWNKIGVEIKEEKLVVLATCISADSSLKCTTVLFMQLSMLFMF